MAATKQRSTVVGVFEDRQQADKAVGELLKAGFRQDQIGVAMRHDEGEVGRRPQPSRRLACGVRGASRGLDRPGSRGSRRPGCPGRSDPRRRPGHCRRDVGRHPLQRRSRGRHRGPGRGPDRGRRARARGQVLHQEFEAGRTIVTVRPMAGPTKRRPSCGGTGVRHKHQSDMADHAAAARTTGASTHAATAEVAGREAETIQVKEERLHAEKRPVETGEVTVRKEVHTETKTLEVPVQREEVVIERTPVHGRAATEGVAAGDIAKASRSASRSARSRSTSARSRW